MSMSSLFFATREAKQKAEWPGSTGKQGQVIDTFALLALSGLQTANFHLFPCVSWSVIHPFFLTGRSCLQPNKEGKPVLDGMVLDRIWLCDIADIEGKSFHTTTEKAEGACVKTKKADCVCVRVRACVRACVRTFLQTCA